MMGEIAEAIINGLMCEQCGVYLKDLEEPGYPRCCKECAKDPEVAGIYKNRIEDSL